MTTHNFNNLAYLSNNWSCPTYGYTTLHRVLVQLTVVVNKILGENWGENWSIEYHLGQWHLYIPPCRAAWAQSHKVYTNFKRI